MSSLQRDRHRTPTAQGLLYGLGGRCLAALVLGLLLLYGSGLTCVDAHESEAQHAGETVCVACVCLCQRVWTEPQQVVDVPATLHVFTAAINLDNTRPHAACAPGIDHPPKF